MTDLHDTIRACPIREWLTRRLRAELPLSSGHKVILSYSLPGKDEPMPRLTTGQIQDLWGPYISGGETVEDIAENIRLQILLEMQINQRQGEIARDVLHLMVDNLDVSLILIQLAAFADSLTMNAEEAVEFGWIEWLERAHDLYKHGV